MCPSIACSIRHTPHAQQGTGEKASNAGIVVILLLAQVGRGGLRELVGTADGSWRAEQKQVSEVRRGRQRQDSGAEGGALNVRMVPPLLVKTPRAPWLTLEVAFLMAAAKRPAPPVIMAPWMPAWRASTGWYGPSSPWDTILEGSGIRFCTLGAVNWVVTAGGRWMWRS